MAKYLWEAKPPITRSDVFSDGWEVGEIHIESDEKASEWIKRLFDRYNIGQSLIVRISRDGRVLRTLKA